MAIDDDLELLNALLALAVVDGKLSGGERGVIEGLAVRVGVGAVSLNAMIDRAQREPDLHESIRITDPKNARRAMELLVAQARIDGEIADEERDMLVKMALTLEIDTDEFGEIYARGVTKADEIRRRRG